MVVDNFLKMKLNFDFISLYKNTFFCIVISILNDPNPIPYQPFHVLFIYYRLVMSTKYLLFVQNKIS